MPRNLTDLFEDAVRAAPPERHHAADITHLAERRQRRRTTFIAAGASLAVVVVAGVVVGLTQHHPSTPEPAQQFKRNQTVDASSAVPASTLPGYHLEPWTVPSVQHLGQHHGPLATYRQVDADGRLVIEDAPGGNLQDPLRLRVFDGPGLGPRALHSPPSPGTNAGNPVVWVPSFQPDGRLLWYRSSQVMDSSKAGIHLTDLQGGHDVFVHTHVQLSAKGFTDVVQPWVSGDRFWFTSFDSATLKGASYSLYSSTFSGTLTKVADKIAVADVNDGIAAWVTTDGQVVTESTAGGSQHTVTIPFTPGCHSVPTVDRQNTGAQPLAVSRSVIAMTEDCGTGSTQRQEILAFDPAGHLLVHVTGLFGFSPSLGHDTLVFRGLVPPGLEQSAVFRYDLVTGSLARLSPVSRSRTAVLGYPQTAGDYVLWYDAQGGHVAKIPG